MNILCQSNLFLCLSTAIMSVVPIYHVAEERNTTTDEREDPH
jgi:hypothetical protein